MKKLLLKQELYKTYWYFHFRLSVKPNLKRLKEALEQIRLLKIENKIR